MDKKKLEIIAELMEQLRDDMEYSPDDLEERLGRKKPEVKIVKVEGEMPMEEEGMDMEDDMEMEEPGSDEMLKKRLMKLRG